MFFNISSRCVWILSSVSLSFVSLILFALKKSLEARLEGWGNASVGEALGEQRRGIEVRSPDSK